MILTIAAILAVLWVLGCVTGFVFKGAIHIIFFVAVVCFLVGLAGAGK
jgi:hypothetical protein